MERGGLTWPLMRIWEDELDICNHGDIAHGLYLQVCLMNTTTNISMGMEEVFGLNAF